jgi:hypothetical protein
MEDPNAPAFVNFANEQLHIGRIISSCIQEEVLFSCAPESFVGLLFVRYWKTMKLLCFESSLMRCASFVQQTMAAALAGKKLEYRTFKDEKLKETLENLL